MAEDWLCVFRALSSSHGAPPRLPGAAAGAPGRRGARCERAGRAASAGWETWTRGPAYTQKLHMARSVVPQAAGVHLHAMRADNPSVPRAGQAPALPPAMASGVPLNSGQRRRCGSHSSGVRRRTRGRHPWAAPPPAAAETGPHPCTSTCATAPGRHGALQLKSHLSSAGARQPEQGPASNRLPRIPGGTSRVQTTPRTNHHVLQHLCCPPGAGSPVARRHPLTRTHTHTFHTGAACTTDSPSGSASFTLVALSPPVKRSCFPLVP